MEAQEIPYLRDDDRIPRYADLLAAMGSEARLRIVRLLLAAHPRGLVVGQITTALGVSGSTLTHHLDRLKAERLVTVQREGTFLRHRVDTRVLRELVLWFADECCTGTAVLGLQGVLAPDRAEPGSG